MSFRINHFPIGKSQMVTLLKLKAPSRPFGRFKTPLLKRAMGKCLLLQIRKKKINKNKVFRQIASVGGAKKNKSPSRQSTQIVLFSCEQVSVYFRFLSFFHDAGWKSFGKISTPVRKRRRRHGEDWFKLKRITWKFKVNRWRGKRFFVEEKKKKSIHFRRFNLLFEEEKSCKV